MEKLITFASAAIASTAVFAVAPVVSDVRMSQDASRTVTINYTLSEGPGIVTVDIQTNAGDNAWVSIGGKHLTYFAGDVNKKVESGEHTMTWLPRRAWPDNEVKENVRAVVSAWALDVPPDYMVVSLTVPDTVFFYTSVESIPFGISNDMYKTDYLVMRKIPAANVTWRMGSPTTEGWHAADEESRMITLGDDYYIGVYEVTQRQYEHVTGADATSIACFRRESDYAMRPMETVSWSTVRGGCEWPSAKHQVGETCFIGKLRTLSGLEDMDLPTEAQWEFACRAGCGDAFYNGKIGTNGYDEPNCGLVARYAYDGGLVHKEDGSLVWPDDYNCTSEQGTAKVGTYAPNAWGLYDMLGNVMEFCLDWYVANPTQEESVAGGPTSGSDRSVRGGGFNHVAFECRCAARKSISETGTSDNCGFRLACSAVVK